MPMISEMLQAGWALLPIPRGQKGPVHSGWNLPSGCITSVDSQQGLQGGNIGLAHAYCTPTPTCAIDIDNYKSAKSWLETHRIDLPGLLHAEDAVVIWSGKKYSLKLIYKLPLGTKPVASTKIDGADGRVVLELRCATRDGKTVQDVLPPSVHPSGTEYRWMGHGDPLLLPEIPVALLNLWGTLSANVGKVANRQFAVGLNDGGRMESPRQIAIIQDVLTYITADCSYEVWRNIVWAILSTRWTCAEAIAQRWSQTGPERYDDAAFWTLVNSYMPQRGNQITVGTLYHHARKGGWHGG